MTSVRSTRPASNSSRLMLMASSLVVVDDPNVPSGARSPFEAYPPLIIDADAVLPVTVAEQRFEAVAGRDSQVVGSLGRVPKATRPRQQRAGCGNGHIVLKFQGKTPCPASRLRWRQAARSAMKIRPIRIRILSPWPTRKIPRRVPAVPPTFVPSQLRRR